MADKYDPKYFDDAPAGDGMDNSLFEDAAPSPSIGEKALTAIEQMSDTRLAGYLPQAKAGLETALEAKDDLLAKIGFGPRADVERLKDQGFNIVEPARGYTAARDRAIREQENRSQRNPGMSAIGSLLGFVGPSAVTGIAGKGAGLAAKAGLGKVAQGALGGAAAGAAYNPGDTEGRVGDLQLAERGASAALGGGLGAVAGKVNQGVSRFKGRADTLKSVDKGVGGDYIKGKIKDVAYLFEKGTPEAKLLAKIERSPLSTLKAAKRGTDAQETLLRIEKQTGLPLTQLSEDITITGKLSPDWRKFFHPLEAPAEMRTRAERAVYNLGGTAAKGAENSADTMTKAILEGLREQRTK